MINLDRRAFTGGLCACATFALTRCATDGAGVGPITPGYRPTGDSDEAGLWQQMAKAEAELKQSRFLVRDPDLNHYVHEIACRLAADHCPDLRLYIVRTPYFNANMAPNGMMQIWTGLLLRTQNEAQLATIIGHELGHYLQRHSLQRWRDVRAKADFGAFLGMGLAVAGAGAIGSLANLALLASIFAYSREQEREADDIGLSLMADAGYRPIEASRVWKHLIAEHAARATPRDSDVFFASHPAPEERFEALKSRAGAWPPNAGEMHQDRFRDRLRGYRTVLFQDELRLRQYGQTLVLFEALCKEGYEDGELVFFTGDVYRLRDESGDRAKAREAYEQALAGTGAPVETYRSLGLLHMRSGEHDAANAAFGRYLELMPNASDRQIIQSYMQSRSS